MTTPERAAQWGIDTGYVAVRPDAWETPTMKKYVAGFPAAAVARDQLQYAVAELSTHENQRVTKALNDGLQAALTGAKTPAQAMKDAQREAERILQAVPAVTAASRPCATAAPRVPRPALAASHRLSVHVHGWLLLLPAAVLLVAVHALPGGGDPRPQLLLDAEAAAGRRVFVGLDNYQAMLDDPVFWQSLGNNAWFALGTIPVSIALALLMAVWVNGKLAGPRASCAWPTSRRPCCR